MTHSSAKFSVGVDPLSIVSVLVVCLLLFKTHTIQQQKVLRKLLTPV